MESSGELWGRPSRAAGHRLEVLLAVLRVGAPGAVGALGAVAVL